MKVQALSAVLVLDILGVSAGLTGVGGCWRAADASQQSDVANIHSFGVAGVWWGRWTQYRCVWSIEHWLRVGTRD